MDKKSLSKTSILMTCGLLMAGCGSVHNKTGRYDSYRGLAMAGYQGWFNAEGDGADRGYYHYRGKDGGFRPGSASVDMWPDMSEYKISYPTEFRMADGSAARVFSSYDEETVETHFRWMKKYGLDGVFMQRFVSEVAGESGKKHFDKVLLSAMKSAIRYDRAICVMYDLSGMHTGDEDFVLRDLEGISRRFAVKDRKVNPSYLHHNGKPLVAVWGVGFNDRRNYTLDDCRKLIDGIKAMGFSVLVGVPTYWREFGRDTENNPALHDLIRSCDIVMPWFVARYTPDSFDDFKAIVAADGQWCDQAGVDYAPLVFPGFSWKNLYGENTLSIPRQEGRFMERQVENALASGAEMLYFAMFDEIDEGTAIFKCASKVPVDSLGTKFLPLEPGVPSDRYLKIAGDAARKLKKKRRGG